MTVDVTETPAVEVEGETPQGVDEPPPGTAATAAAATDVGGDAPGIGVDAAAGTAAVEASPAVEAEEAPVDIAAVDGGDGGDEVVAEVSAKSVDKVVVPEEVVLEGAAAASLIACPARRRST